MSVPEERARVAREYTRLLAEYTSLEGSRRRAAEGALVSQQRQRDLIDTITRENAALKAELDLCRLSRTSETAPAMSVSLHDQLDLYLGKVELEVKTIERLEALVEKKRARHLSQLRVASGSHAVREQRLRLEAHAAVGRRRLERGHAQLNAAAASTRALRTTIDELKQERAVVEHVRVRLERDSRRSARALATTVEAASAAHEARDAADLSVARLEAALASERGAFEAGLAAADGAVDAQVAAAMREVMGMRGQLTMAEESVLQGALREGRGALERDADAAKKAHARVRLFEATFASLASSWGVTGIDALAQLLRQSEDATFALFACAAAQGLELQRLEESLGELRRGGGRGGGPARSEERLPPVAGAAATPERAAEQRRQRAALLALEDALALESAAAARAEAAHVESRALLESVRAATEDLVRACGGVAVLAPGAHFAPFDGGALSDASVLAALGLVEQFAHGLLARYAALVVAAGGASPPPLPQATLRRRGPGLGVAMAGGGGGSVSPLASPPEAPRGARALRAGAAAAPASSTAEGARRTAAALLGSGPPAPPRSDAERIGAGGLGSSSAAASLLSRLPAPSPTSARGGGAGSGGASSWGEMGEDDGVFVHPLSTKDLRRRVQAQGAGAGFSGAESSGSVGPADPGCSTA